ncbi:hypothetical protein ANN_24964 [Periplaneta americana]|uniref:Uncharacterized protein n=1 Tax=Periplaneta americana TaxID=6978 RepID=A0ABQ8S027_PERAM|nr:hypothetical protein ANN_24964 [Periplaneta americana]
MWIWRRTERVKWADRIRNEAVLERVDEERMMLKLIRKRERNWLGHWMRRNCLLKEALEGMVNGRRVRVEKLLSSSLLSKNLKVRIYKTVILPVVLYGCETWTLTLREEQRLRVFENNRTIFGAKRDEVTREWRKLHNAELHGLYSSPDLCPHASTQCEFHNHGPRVALFLLELSQSSIEAWMVSPKHHSQTTVEVFRQCVESENIRRKYLPPSMLSQNRSSLACLDLMGNRECEQKTGLFLLKARQIRTSAVEVYDAN